MSVYLPKIEDYIIDNSLLDELKVNNFLKGRNLKQSHYSLPAICEISTDQRQRKYKNVSQKIIHSKVSSSDGCVKAVKQRPEVNGQVDRPGEDTDVRKKESCSKSNFSYSKQNSDGLHKRAVHRETLCLINTDLTTATKNGSKHDILDDTCRSTVDLHVNKSAVHDAQNSLERFSQAVKAIMILRKLASVMIKQSEEPSVLLKTFNDIMDLSDNFNTTLKNQGLSFDPFNFKANKEISISNEVKSILNLPPEFRTREQIQTAIFGLRCLPSFAEYPLHMQEKLAKVAWYEVVQSNRTIIRQGHVAEKFYFILAGQAVVTVLIRDTDTNETCVRTANFMKKGISFGELALLHHSRRTATVTSQDTMQLLSIGRDDFFNIFMAPDESNELPGHIHFIRRNVVIVKDSRRSDWLYIVKSGSCQVLKRLTSVTGRRSKRKRYVLNAVPLPSSGDMEIESITSSTVTSLPTLQCVHGKKSSVVISTSVYRPSEENIHLYDNRILHNTCMTKSHNSAVFVQVSRLKPKDIFGLDFLSFHDGMNSSVTSVSLVSHGAECVMISKNFYRKHATNCVKTHLQQIVRPYPDESVFQESLQRKADWDLYKSALINERYQGR